jgi:hypothetical protein
MILNTLLDQQIDIDFFLLDVVWFGFNYVVSAVEDAWLIFFFGKTLYGFHACWALNHYLVQLKFDRLSFNHFFFDGVSADKSVHIDLLFLADSVGSVHRLQVVLRVEIRVVNNYVVCRNQIDAEAARLGRNQKHE